MVMPQSEKQILMNSKKKTKKDEKKANILLQEAELFYPDEEAVRKDKYKIL